MKGNALSRRRPSCRDPGREAAEVRVCANSAPARVHVQVGEPCGALDEGLLQGEQAALEIARGELDQGALVPETVRGQALELVHRAPRALRVSGSHEPEREAGAAAGARAGLAAAGPLARARRATTETSARGARAGRSLGPEQKAASGIPARPL